MEEEIKGGAVGLTEFVELLALKGIYTDCEEVKTMVKCGLIACVRIKPPNATEEYYLCSLFEVDRLAEEAEAGTGIFESNFN